VEAAEGRTAHNNGWSQWNAIKHFAFPALALLNQVHLTPTARNEKNKIGTQGFMVGCFPEMFGDQLVMTRNDQLIGFDRLVTTALK
jgi:hypothetical protein